MVLRLIKGCLIVDTWQEEGYVFSCEGNFATAFLRAGAAVIATDYNQDTGIPANPSHETTEHQGQKQAEKAVKKPQR